MAITKARVDPKLLEEEIAKRLLNKAGRCLVLVDQDFQTSYPNVEIIDIRTTALSALSSSTPSHVLYAVDQDDLGLPFVTFLIEHKIKFYAAWQANPARWIHKDSHARSTVESEYLFQVAAGFAKFDFGYGDFENICQALSITRSIGGAYVEVGCFRGSSGGIALQYMRHTGIYRPTFFLDVFDGFTYEAAKSSTDAVWAGGHETDGLSFVTDRLKRFEQRLLGRSVDVIKNNIITDNLPSAIQTIAVANLDVDQLEAVYSGLVKLAPKIAIGGILIVEDPGHTPLLIGAQAALNIFLKTDVARHFLPVYLDSGQYFLIRIS